jgi:hypothetical protein
MWNFLSCPLTVGVLLCHLFIKVASTTVFDLIRSSSGRYFYVIAAQYSINSDETPIVLEYNKMLHLQARPCKLNSWIQLIILL